MFETLKNRWWILIGVSVLSIGLLSGCGQMSYAESELIVTRSPVPAGILRAGDLQEIEPPVDLLKGWRIVDIQVSGDVLIGLPSQAPDAPIAINLRTRQVAGIDQPLSIAEWADGGKSQIDRYYAWLSPRYTDGKYQGREINVVDLHSGKVWSVEGSGWVDIDGNMVVYAKNKGHPNAWDLYAQDLRSGEIKPIIEREGPQVRPKIDGDWVVYLDSIPQKGGYEQEYVYAHNLATGEDVLLGETRFASQSEGRTYYIDNGRAVWVGWQGEKPETFGVHVFDVQSRTVYTLNLEPDYIPPTFYMDGDLLLFGCPDGFCGYDLAQKKLFNVPYPHKSSGFIYVSENYIVFRVEESKRTTMELYLTPGMPTPTPLPIGATPSPSNWHLFIVPITRK